MGSTAVTLCKPGPGGKVKDLVRPADLPGAAPERNQRVDRSLLNSRG
jgi:hypothetical protein